MEKKTNALQGKVVEGIQLPYDIPAWLSDQWQLTSGESTYAPTDVLLRASELWLKGVIPDELIGMSPEVKKKITLSAQEFINQYGTSK